MSGCPVTLPLVEASPQRARRMLTAKVSGISVALTELDSVDEEENQRDDEARFDHGSEASLLEDLDRSTGVALSFTTGTLGGPMWADGPPEEDEAPDAGLCSGARFLNS